MYASILIPTAGISSLLVDGASLPALQIKVHPNNPAYSLAVANLTNNDMQHTITSDSAFTALVNGIGFFESYGYNVGTLINNLNSYPVFKNVFSAVGSVDTTTCTHTPLRFSLKTAYRLSSINWKLSQAGGGISPSADSLINNPIPSDSSFINNRKYYTYTLQQDFTFSIAGTWYLPIAYSAPGIDQCNNTENVLLKVVVTPGPLADFSFTNPNCLSDSVHFTGTSTTTGFVITSYLWNFDDLTTQTTLNAVKKFSTSGNQNVRYRIFANNGCAGDTTKIITIYDNPIANFGFTSPICPKDSIRITDSSSITLGSITTYQWNFGDGNTLTRTTNTPFFHQYNNSGLYTIKLVLTSNNGCKSDTAFRVVTVSPAPLARFGYDRSSICVNDSIRLTDTSSISGGSIVSYHWNFGDGNTLVRSTNTPFYHPYTITGTFIISLVTVSNLGCVSDTFRKTEIVGLGPVADFSFTNPNCLNDSIHFTATSTTTGYNIITYLWNFDDLTTQSTVNAVKKFTAAGNQNIRCHAAARSAEQSRDRLRCR